MPLRSQNLSRLSGMTGIQSIDARGKEPLLQSDDRRSHRCQSALDGAECSALGQHQDEPGAEDIAGGQGSGLGNTAEFLLLTFAEHPRIDRYNCLDASRISNVYSATCH